MWLLNVFINVTTGIVQVVLPFWDRKNPLQGSKAARESIIKLISDMNNDVSPLSYRSEYKLNSDQKDPYYKAAPGWTTLTGGSNPTHACTPTQACEWLATAVDCVPFVSGLKFTIIENDGSQTVVDLDDIRKRNIPLTAVPRLTNNSSPNSNPNNATSAATGEANQLREQLTIQSGHVKALEEQVAALKALWSKPTCSQRRLHLKPSLPPSVPAAPRRQEVAQC